MIFQWTRWTYDTYIQDKHHIMASDLFANIAHVKQMKYMKLDIDIFCRVYV